MPHDENDHEVALAVQAERINQITRRMEAAERKIWGAIIGVLGITITIASEILKAGAQ